MNVAIIPARGGSKRIPRKNIREFAGQPMIAHSIRAAADAGIFEHIIVSTDDEEIATIARKYGAQTPFVRPSDLANDFVGTMEVIQHAINELEKIDCHPNFVCCLYATAPFVSSAILLKSLEKLKASGSAYAFPVCTFGFPIQRALRISPAGNIQPMYPEYRFTRSQDLEEAYQDAGQFYWGKSAAWKTGEVLYSEASMSIPVPRHLVQDIDTEEDWVRAEWLYRAWKHSEEGKTQL